MDKLKFWEIATIYFQQQIDFSSGQVLFGISPPDGQVGNFYTFFSCFYFSDTYTRQAVDEFYYYEETRPVLWSSDETLLDTTSLEVNIGQ